MLSMTHTPLPAITKPISLPAETDAGWYDHCYLMEVTQTTCANCSQVETHSAFYKVMGHITYTPRSKLFRRVPVTKPELEQLPIHLVRYNSTMNYCSHCIHGLQFNHLTAPIADLGAWKEALAKDAKARSDAASKAKTNSSKPSRPAPGEALAAFFDD